MSCSTFVDFVVHRLTYLFRKNDAVSTSSNTCISTPHSTADS